MADYNDTYGVSAGAAAFPWDTHCVSRFTAVLNFDNIAKARSVAGAPALAVGDTLAVMSVPKGAVILGASVAVERAEVAAPTATIDFGALAGTPVDAKDFGDAVPLNATGLTPAAMAAPVVVTADGVLNVKLNTAVPKDAIVRLTVVAASVA